MRHKATDKQQLLPWRICLVKLVQQLQYKGPQPTHYDYSSSGEHNAYGGITQRPQLYPQQGYIPPSQLLNAGLGNDYSGHHHGGATGTGLVPIPFWIIIRFSIPCSITQNRMGTRLCNRMSSLFKYTPHFLDHISTFTLFIPLFFPLQWLYLLSRPSPVVIVV